MEVRDIERGAQITLLLLFVGHVLKLDCWFLYVFHLAI